MTEDRLAEERLKTLIDCYGAEPRRWPEAERAAAERLAASTAGQALLAQARALDSALDAAPRLAPSRAQIDRAVGAALTQGLNPRTIRRWGWGGLAWLAGAGWAAAACAGVVAGVGLNDRLTADLRADAVLYQASLLAVDDAELLETAG